MVSLATDHLTIDSSFRDGGLNHEHVERLAQLAGRWPPIVVARANGLVIDGAHRVAAARLLGMERIDASYFDGGPAEALIEFVRRNVYQGLPLTLKERKRAAARVLLAHPDWSDRRIAELCALSPKTVGRQRVMDPALASGPQSQSNRGYRIGRDNKSRRVDRTSIENQALGATRKHRDGPLTAMEPVGESSATPTAATTGSSRASRPDPPRAVPTSTAVGPPSGADLSWKHDVALASSDDGDDFVAWLDRTRISEADPSRFEALAVSRAREIAEEARRRSTVWMCLARSLEARANNRE